MNKIIKYWVEDSKESLILFKNDKSLFEGVYELHNKKGLLYDCVIKYQNDFVICRHLVKPEVELGILHPCIRKWVQIKIQRLFYVPHRWEIF